MNLHTKLRHLFKRRSKMKTTGPFATALMACTLGFSSTGFTQVSVLGLDNNEAKVAFEGPEQTVDIVASATAFGDVTEAVENINIGPVRSVPVQKVSVRLTPDPKVVFFNPVTERNPPVEGQPPSYVRLSEIDFDFDGNVMKIEDTNLDVLNNAPLDQRTLDIEPVSITLCTSPLKTKPCENRTVTAEGRVVFTKMIIRQKEDSANSTVTNENGEVLHFIPGDIDGLVDLFIKVDVEGVPEIPVRDIRVTGDVALWVWVSSEPDLVNKIVDVRMRVEQEVTLVATATETGQDLLEDIIEDPADLALVTGSVTWGLDMLLGVDANLEATASVTLPDPPVIFPLQTDEATIVTTRRGNFSGTVNYTRDEPRTELPAADDRVVFVLDSRIIFERLFSEFEETRDNAYRFRGLKGEEANIQFDGDKTTFRLNSGPQNFRYISDAEELVLRVLVGNDTAEDPVPMIKRLRRLEASVAPGLPDAAQYPLDVDRVRIRGSVSGRLATNMDYDRAETRTSLPDDNDKVVLLIDGLPVLNTTFGKFRGRRGTRVRPADVFKFRELGMDARLVFNDRETKLSIQASAIDMRFLKEETSLTYELIIGDEDASAEVPVRNRLGRITEVQ